MVNTSDVLVAWDPLFRNTVANLANLGQHVDSGPVGAQPFDLNFTLGRVLDTVHLGDKSVTTILCGIGIGIGIGDLPIGSMVTSLLQGGGAKAAAGGRTRGDAYGGDGAGGARGAAGPADAGGAVSADPGTARQAGSAGEAGTRGADGAPG